MSEPAESMDRESEVDPLQPAVAVMSHEELMGLLDPYGMTGYAADREEVERHGRELAARYGERLTLERFCREAGVTAGCVRRHFGRWTDFRQRLGLARRPPTPKRAAAAETVERDFREAVGRVGDSITLAEFCRETGYSERVVHDRFGSFAGLRTRVGLSPRASPGKRFSDAELLADVGRVWEAVARPGGRRPTVTEYIRLGRYSYPTVFKRLGHWRDVLDRVAEERRAD